MRIYYCDQYDIPLPEGHKFPMRKYRLLRDALESDGMFRLESSKPVGIEAICLAHDRDYADRFLTGTLPAPMMRRIGFPWSEGLVQRTLASVGGTLAACEDALSSGVGGTLSGGTHHAFRAEGSGFCVFNDVAIAIHSLRGQGRIRRAAVVDLDVHQGDGTAHFFEHDPDVLTISLHGEKNFPLQKQRSKIDVELPDGTTDQPYLDALGTVLPRVCEFRPAIVFYLSGVDALATDALGRLALTIDGMKRRDRMVIEACAGATPVVITLGGGYSKPIDATIEAHANTFRTAAQVFGAGSHGAATRRLSFSS